MIIDRSFKYKGDDIYFHLEMTDHGVHYRQEIDGAVILREFDGEIDKTNQLRKEIDTKEYFVIGSDVTNYDGSGRWSKPTLNNFNIRRELVEQFFFAPLSTPFTGLELMFNHFLKIGALRDNGTWAEQPTVVSFGDIDVDGKVVATIHESEDGATVLVSLNDLTMSNARPLVDGEELQLLEGSNRIAIITAFADGSKTLFTDFIFRTSDSLEEIE